MNINYPYITEYIRNTIAPNDELLQELENYAVKHNIPIVQLETAKLISVLCMIKKPKKILEIGTAIGYSSILMAKSINDVEVITIEQNDNLIEIANNNIRNANLSNTIKILEGSAQDVLKSIDETFDLVFIDAGKGHYMEFLNLCIDKLNDDGIIVSDNILYRGMVANDELIDKRDRTIVKRMREYLNYICNSDKLQTSIIPIGDGVAVSTLTSLKSEKRI